MFTTEDFRDSSIRNMAWAALLGSERLLYRASISDPSIDELLDHLWAWTTVDYTTFGAWYDSRPDLVDVGLGDPLPEGLANAFERAGIRPSDGYRLLQALTEVIYGSMFAAVDWLWVEKAFTEVIGVLGDYEHGVPNPALLPASSRQEGHGWGHAVDSTTLDLIRHLEW
jgi:hypothetical protein